jgi:hypothetical protein
VGALLGIFGEFFVISRRISLADQDILGESPDVVETTLGVTESEGFGELRIGLIIMSAKCAIKICHPIRDD